MCAELIKTKEILEEFERSGIEYLHIDIMDGHFVPNFMLSTEYIKTMKQLTKIPLDIHLMIEKPDDKLDWFQFGEGDIVSVHVESTCHIQKVLTAIRNRGAKAFLALNPGTPLCVLDEIKDDVDGILIMTVNPGFAGQKMIPATLEKVRKVKAIFKEIGRDIPVEVDGNVTYENAVIMREAGADIFVVGTSSILARGIDLHAAIEKMRNCVN